MNIDAKCAALDEHLPEAIHCYNQAVKGYAKEGNAYSLISEHSIFDTRLEKCFFHDQATKNNFNRTTVNFSEGKGFR